MYFLDDRYLSDNNQIGGGCDLYFGIVLVLLRNGAISISKMKE